MNARWYDRLAAVVSIILLAVLAAVSFYLAEKARRQETVVGKRVPSSDPDYFIEGFAATKTSPDGSPSYRLTASRATHRPDIDGFDLTNPKAVSLNPERPGLVSSADRGVTVDGKSRTELSGHVKLVRTDRKTGEVLTIDTEKAVLLTELDRATSDQYVTITRSGSVLTGKGMEFDNANRDLKVLADVKLHIVPRAPREAARTIPPR